AFHVTEFRRVLFRSGPPPRPVDRRRADRASAAPRPGVVDHDRLSEEDPAHGIADRERKPDDRQRAQQDADVHPKPSLEEIGSPPPRAAVGPPGIGRLTTIDHLDERDHGPADEDRVEDGEQPADEQGDRQPRFVALANESEHPKQGWRGQQWPLTGWWCTASGAMCAPVWRRRRGQLARTPNARVVWPAGPVAAA